MRQYVDMNEYARSRIYQLPLTLSKNEACIALGIDTNEFDDWRQRGVLPEPIVGTCRWSRGALTRAVDKEEYIAETGANWAAETSIPQDIFSEKKASFAAFIEAYQSMNNPLYARLAPSTRQNYDLYLAAARERFGHLSSETLNNPRVRMVFKQWRDEAADRPRVADMRMTILSVILAKALDDGEIFSNYAKGIGKLYRKKSGIRIWTEKDIAAFKATAPEHIFQAVWLGRLTGARLSALLALAPENLIGGWLDFDPQKRGHRVRIKLSEYSALKRAIYKLPRSGPRLLLNTYGNPWTADGFKASFRKARIKAGITVRFHDLRVTAITHWSKRLTAEKISLLTGHSLKNVAAVLNNHYIQRNDDRVVEALRCLQ